MKELIDQISNTIMDYRSLDDKLVFEDAETINGLMKNLSSDLFFLEKYRDEMSQDFYRSIHRLVKSGESATGAINNAKNLHPEKRMLDRFIVQANKVLDSMRSNSSFLKMERNNN